MKRKPFSLKTYQREGWLWHPAGIRRCPGHPKSVNFFFRYRLKNVHSPISVYTEGDLTARICKGWTNGLAPVSTPRPLIYHCNLQHSAHSGSLRLTQTHSGSLRLIQAHSLTHSCTRSKKSDWGLALGSYACPPGQQRYCFVLGQSAI